MSVRVEFPVFVSVERHPTTGKRAYVVRALFVPDLLGSGRTFERALQRCTRAARKRFAQLTTRRENVGGLMWLAFNPELMVRTLQLNLSGGQLGIQTVDLMLAMFDLSGHRYVYFPRLDHVMMMPAGLRWAEQIDRIQADLFALMRQMRQEMAPKRPDLDALVAQKGDFITTVATSLAVRRGSFSFDSDGLSALFAGMSGPDKVDGGVELPRVARNLNHDFPDTLQRAASDDAWVSTITEAIYTKNPAPLALVGPPGAGRTTLLHEAIARQLEDARQRQVDSDRLQQVWHLDPTRVISGMAIIGAWQRRAEAVFTHLCERLSKRFSIRRADALFIDNPIALCRVGRSAGSDLTLATVLRPYVERRAMPVILEASPEAWQKLETLDRPFADLFRVVRIQPPPRTAALRILIRRRDHLEASAGVEIHRGALRRIVELEDRYPSERATPGSLVERLERLVDQVSGDTVDVEQVERIFLRRSGMRAEMIDPTKALEPASLLQRLSGQLIGQPEAVAALADVVHTTRAGVSPPGKPAASMLMVGPTGVGKTEAAKRLAATLYEDEGALIRLDMNEYVDADAARRLIGDLRRPEGQLTGRIRHRPFCVLLLDEIEKAHPSVHDLLLQVLDEGRLTDSVGRVSDFSQAIVVLTSNVGARDAGRQTGFDRSLSGLAATYRAALRRTFRPEFLNRIDQVVVFGALAPEHIARIAQLQLSRMLLREGLLRRTVLLELAPAVLDHLAVVGFDPLMGARALKRAIETELVAPLANLLVPIPIEQATTVNIDVADGALVMTDAPLPMLPRADRPRLSEAVEAAPENLRVSWALERVRETIALLRSMSDTSLAAVASPEGVSVPEEMMMLSRLIELEYMLEDYASESEAEPDLGPAVMAGRAWGRKPRVSRNRNRKPFWRSYHGPTAQEHAAHTHLRDVLQDLMEGEAYYERWNGYNGVPVNEVADLIQRGQSIFREGPTGAAVFLRNLTAAAEDTWAMFQPLLEAWGKRLEAWDIDCTTHFIDPRGRIVHTLDEPGDRIWVLQGPGAAELLSGEEGIHLFYPDDEPPQALQVQLAPLGGGPPPLEALLAEWTVPTGQGRRPAAVRQYCPPDLTNKKGSVSDLRSGMVVPFTDLDRWIPDWLLHGQDDAVRLEFVP